MSDHSRRHTKPTSEEVYQDAKRILEEYLKRKLNEHSEFGENNNKKYARSESYKAASRENVVDDSETESLADEQQGVERSKTMPSSFRTDKLHHDDKDKLRKTKTRQDKYSSSDTEAELSDDEKMQQRKKKSIFKRAKERLMHALHRDGRSGDEDVDVYDNSKNKQKKRSKRKNKKLENGIHDSPDMNTRYLKETHAHIDQHISIGEDYGSRGHSLRIPTEGSSSLQDSHSSSSRRNSVGKKFLDSVRKSFRKNKKKDISESKSAEPVSLDERDRSYSRSISTPDRSTHLGDGSNLQSGQGLPSRSGSETPELRQTGKAQNVESSRRNSKSKADVVVSQSSDHSAPRRMQVRGVHVDSDTFSSVAPTPYVPPHFKGSIDSSVDIDRTAEMILTDDGLWERSVTTHSRERTKYLPGSLEIDGKVDDHGPEDEVDSPIDSQPDKEEAIDKIVKKLIEIGDNLSSEGEARQSQESEGAVGGAPSRRGDERLTSLEREIIEYLRMSGDKASDCIDGHANELINGAVRETVYEKFSNTLRQSIGDDVNWNQMALVFHATKSALKVAGAGTKMAGQIKDLTLKYVTEKCASWIVDQGGWESIVSDTDSELD